MIWNDNECFTRRGLCLIGFPGGKLIAVIFVQWNEFSDSSVDGGAKAGVGQNMHNFLSAPERISGKGGRLAMSEALLREPDYAKARSL